MRNNVYKFICPALAKEHPAYQMECQAERKQTQRVIDFINKVLKLEKMNKSAITKRLRMGNGQLSKILNCPSDMTLTESIIGRLAIGLVTLLPDLNKSESMKHLCHGTTYPYAVCRIDDTDQQEELRKEFEAAFAPMGSYLVNDLKDLGVAMKALDDYHQSYSNL